jgi:hypothetical protein
MGSVMSSGAVLVEAYFENAVLNMQGSRVVQLV